MNELIPVAPRQIGGVTMLTTDARGLHTFLGPDTEFSHWITRRIDEYKFEEGRDFQSFLAESTGGRPPKEYTLTLNMAKELAMVERTPKGKEARQYYIDCEARALAVEASALPTSKLGRIRSSADAQQATARIKALTMVTREVARVPGVRPEAAAAAFLTMVERETGLQVSDLRQALPSTPAAVAFQLNPTHLAKRLGIEGLRAAHVNLALIAVGLQVEGERDYVVTEKGAEFGEMRAYTNPHNGHQGYQSVWSADVVPILVAYFHQNPQAALPLPRAPRTKSKHRRNPAAVIEPQGALL
ncbi:MAG: antA/AntB antirepressor family protein [Pseudorhodoferax sp.]